GGARGNREAAAKADGDRGSGARALQFKGEVYEKLGKPKEAAETYRQALKADSEAEEVLTALIRLELAANRRTEAVDYLRRYTVVVGNDLKGLIQAAEFHLRLGRYEDAFELASRAREKRFSAQTQRILGLVYLHRGDYEHAVFHLDRAEPDAQVLEGLIRGYLALGRLGEA